MNTETIQTPDTTNVQPHMIKLIGADRITRGEARHARRLIARDNAMIDKLIESRSWCASREASDLIESQIKAISRRVAVRQFDLDLALSMGA